MYDLGKCQQWILKPLGERRGARYTFSKSYWLLLDHNFYNGEIGQVWP